MDKFRSGNANLHVFNDRYTCIMKNSSLLIRMLEEVTKLNKNELLFDFLIEKRCDEDDLKNINDSNNLDEWFDIEDSDDVFELIRFYSDLKTVYLKIINWIVKNDDELKVGDLLLLDTSYRELYGRALVGYDILTNKKILVEDGEGEPIFSEYVINKLKKLGVKYTKANQQMNDVLHYMHIDDDVMIVPPTCLDVDSDLNLLR